MLKEELLKWAEENTAEKYEEYIREDFEEIKKILLKDILKSRRIKEPLFVIGLHPEVLKKLNIKVDKLLLSSRIKRFLEKVNGRYVYTIYL